MNHFEERPRSAGMSDVESAAKGALLENASRRLHELRGAASYNICSLFVPGRLELLGKHTDYAGGRSIVCAIERGICVVAAPRLDGQVRIVDLKRTGSDSEISVALDAGVEPKRKNWSNYAAVVARRFARDFPAARTGADLVIASDLPRASGMSSSSALIIGIFMALAEVNSLEQNESYRKHIQNGEDLAGYLAAVESGAEFAFSSGSRGVGTLGGSEDHVAILCSRAGFLRQYSYCPVRLEKEIPLQTDLTFVIGCSGVKADKTGNALEAYNRISLAARKILELWRENTGRSDATLAGALQTANDAAERLRQIVIDSSDAEFSTEVLLNRLSQFIEESNEIVPSAGEVLARGDVETFGGLADRSQSLAEALLGNQIPETIELARSARAIGGRAASAFGAGFGGSVWVLVPSSGAGEFQVKWAASYSKAYPARAETSEFFVTRAGPGLIRFQL
ncbi:MAG TPA: galactokinase family protein [Candidatus Acidoferrales bacterium]|nr:galactokinase family protein [Candidatus Acidoferrales bacterium]